MHYRFWVIASVCLAILVPASPVMFILASWKDSDHWGESGAVMLFLTIAAVVAYGIWTEECTPQRDKPERRLPRAERKELPQAQARISLANQIKKAEQEAGL